jgi:hypothetical protein
MAWSNLGATVAPGEPVIVAGQTFATVWLSGPNPSVQPVEQTQYPVTMSVRVAADFYAVAALYTSSVAHPGGPSGLTRLAVLAPCADPTVIGELCTDPSVDVSHAQYLWVHVGGASATDMGNFTVSMVWVM